MKIFVIRHGESETNEAGRWTGWYNASLTQKGIEDAKKAGEYIKNVSFDKVYTSDLDRAIDTMKIALPGYEYETTPLIREINVGTLEYEPFDTLSLEKRQELIDKGFGEFDGETREQFEERIGKFVKVLETLDCENVAVFCHGGWLKGVLEVIFGNDFSRENFMCRNCAIGIFEYNNGKWLIHSWVNML